MPGPDPTLTQPHLRSDRLSGAGNGRYGAVVGNRGFELRPPVALCIRTPTRFRTPRAGSSPDSALGGRLSVDSGPAKSANRSIGRTARTARTTRGTGTNAKFF